MITKDSIETTYDTEGSRCALNDAGILSKLCLPNKKPLPFRESTEKVHNVKWINNWTLLTGLLRNVKLLHIINAKYLRISLIFSILAEKTQLC